MKCIHCSEEHKNNNTGCRNSGDRNSGDYNSGVFNTNEPKIRSFNKECDLTYTEFRNKYDYNDIELPINSWIDKENMTNEEKKNINGWEQVGGYLKKLNYKEAWQIAWQKSTQKQKDWYFSLPNFDADIFKEITGIEISDKKQELLKKADELISNACKQAFEVRKLLETLK